MLHRRGDRLRRSVSALEVLSHLVDDDDGVIDEKAERHDHSEDRDLMERAAGEGGSEEHDRRGQGKRGSDGRIRWDATMESGDREHGRKEDRLV